MIDVIAAGVLFTGLIWVTIVAYADNPRATAWAKGFARYVVGPVIIILLSRRALDFQNPIMQLRVDLASTPQAPISGSADAIQALIRACRPENFLSLVLGVFALAYCLENVPQIVATRRAKAADAKGATPSTTP